MASDNLERNLREGIEAARRGDKLTARRLLQQVLQQDRTNETALLWMASVVDTVPEKRAYLEQVLRVNPNNDRARQALERMGGAPPPARPASSGSSSTTTSRPTPTPAPKPATKRRGMNIYFAAAIGVAVFMGLVLVLFLLTQPGSPEEDQSQITPTETTLAMLAADGTEAVEATESPEPTATQAPVATTLGVLVTLDPSQAALPPTFTPTPTLEPTATLTPSPTPIPLSAYPILFAAAKPTDVIPSLFVGLADGSDIREVGDNLGYYDIALSPDKTQLVFVRDIAPAGSDAPNWQIFIAPVSDPTDARQITNQLNTDVEHPVWSSDSRSIVYAANYDGDLDLYRVPSNPDGEVEPVALTTNEAYDSYPAFPPGSDTLLFVSDLNSPGFPRLYTMSPSGVVQPFSNVSGSISDPVYSPDGSQIAYVNQQSGDPDIWVITASGERPFQLTLNDSATDRSLAWSDDGQWIAFASDRINDRFMWYLLNVSTQQVTPLGDLAEAQSIAFLPR
ncbi:MAG: hypothetical protein U0452_13810 [Anaerolineae bacterium]